LSEQLRKKAVLDANINRVAEGLRVAEDWARFYLRDPGITHDLRKVRHGLWDTVKESYPDIIKGRDTGEDILAGTEEGERKKGTDIPRASLNRVKEGLRVLEEFGKLVSASAGSKFKKMRFIMYDIEKKFYG